MAVDDLEEPSALRADFDGAVRACARAVEPPKVMVSLPLDADLVAHFQSETEADGWQKHINGVLRFYMETNQGRDADFQAVMHQPEPDGAPGIAI